MKIAYNVLLPEQDTVNYEIYLMDVDGQNQENLTSHPGVDWLCHGWKNHLYFISDRDTTPGLYFLYQCDWKKRQLQKLGNHRMADSWLDSRYDGSELIICSLSADFRSIIIIDTTGYEIREVLRTNQYMISDPAFSPDGHWIVFRSDRSGTDELWITDELGANQRQLTHYPANLKDPGPDYYHAGPPRWVPGNSTISYTSRRNDRYHIFSIHMDGTQNLQVTKEAGNQGWHSWSPKGDLLVFDGSLDQSFNSDIYLLNMTNQKLTQLTDTDFPERAPILLCLQQ